MKKRIISVLLTITMLCAMLPQLSFFAKAGESKYEYYRQLYTSYLLNGGYENMLSDIFYQFEKEDLRITSALVDMNADGVYELLLGCTDTSSWGPRGNPTQYALFSVVDSEIVILERAYYGGGSMGGDSVCFSYDTQ